MEKSRAIAHTRRETIRDGSARCAPVGRWCASAARLLTSCNVNMFTVHIGARFAERSETLGLNEDSLELRSVLGGRTDSRQTLTKPIR